MAISFQHFGEKRARVCADLGGSLRCRSNPSAAEQSVPSPVISDVQLYLENSGLGVLEVVEERRRHVEVSVVAGRAFVHNGGGGFLAVGLKGE